MLHALTMEGVDLAQPPVSDEEIIRRYEIYKQCGGSVRQAAVLIGCSEATAGRVKPEYFRRGLHLSHGAREAMSQAGLNGNEARSGWKHTYDDEGKKTGATYWRAPEAPLEDIIEKIKTAISDIRPIEEIAAPKDSSADLMTVYPIADAHIGMMSWAKETGEAYDTKIATQRLVNWVGQCVSSAPASDTAVILDVGDLTHADDHMNMTPTSKHVLDVDTRHYRTIEMTIAAMATAIELAAKKHSNVIVKIIPGNHNINAYLPVLFSLAERYRDNPRIKVEARPGEFFVKQFGKVLIAAHHGDKARPNQLVHFIADEYAELWGKTKHRFLFTGHLHHLRAQDIGGMQHEQLRAITSRDPYAVSHAFSARSQLQCITYHRETGEKFRFSVNG